MLWKKITGDLRDSSQYSNPDHDERGDWASANMVGIATAERRPNLHYDLINPETGINYGCPSMGWRYEPKTMNILIEEKEYFGLKVKAVDQEEKHLSLS